MSENSKRHIGILGSTGSIGKQALQVIEANPNFFQVEFLSANNNAELLIAQAKKFQPNAVCIVNEDKYESVKEHLWPLGIKTYAGTKALDQIVELEDVDMVLAAMVGFAGLSPTVQAIRAGKHIALANKETLVVAGQLVTTLAVENRVSLLPVDSEHSAIFQCLVGEDLDTIEKLILTCSGGPFRGKKEHDLRFVSKEQALNHPNWTMGSKITIDSATLMNKGLEVIEAKWLFGLKPEQIEVVVHPQSILHSMVQFNDGSMKAQMGLPDMKLPIQYALAFPQRLRSDFKRFNFTDYPKLTFERADSKTFRNLGLAYEAMDKGGNMPCILNAANEIAVDAFLRERIKFLDIPEIIEHSMEKVFFVEKPNMDDYVTTDKETRHIAGEMIA